jgi:hypothetical protein
MLLSVLCIASLDTVSPTPEVTGDLDRYRYLVARRGAVQTMAYLIAKIDP